ncbi:MAG: type I secretion system permease/ATPase [Pseudomonadota bacterium]
MRTKRLFDGQRGLIASIFIVSIFVNILILTAPLYMLQLFSRVMSSGSVPTLIALTIGAGIALIFFFLFDAIRQRLVARLGTRLEARTGPLVLKALMGGNLPADVQSSQPIRDLQVVRGFVTSPVLIALLDAPWSVLFLALIFLFHPLLGLVAMAGLMMLFALGLISEVAGRKPSQSANEASTEANSAVDEMLMNAEVVHAMGQSQAMVERWTYKSFASIVFGTVASDRVALMTSLAKTLRMGLQIAVLGVGVVLVLRNELTPGLMIAASILLGRAAAPVEQSIAGWTALLTARQARDRLNRLLSHVGETEQQMELPEPDGRLSIEGATVLMQGHQNPTLLDVSLELRPGQSLGIIGPSGAGKTTLARAIVGLQPLSRGYIRIDDAALTDWPAEQIGRHIGFLPQRTDLFRGTVAENIAMMNQDAKPSDIVAAAKVAQVHDLILKLPGGYNYDVGPRGEALSAGQRQRIGLARAFFGDRKVIVLDEPNANLDPSGEMALAQAIRTATERGAIVIVITHRMNLLREVSHAAVLQDGRIARFGEARSIIEAVAQPITKANVEASPANIIQGQFQSQRTSNPGDIEPTAEATGTNDTAAAPKTGEAQ